MWRASSTSFMIDGASTKGIAGSVLARRWCCPASMKCPAWPSSWARVNALRIEFVHVIRMNECTP